jgi:hypothetical protein
MPSFLNSASHLVSIQPARVLPFLRIILGGLMRLYTDTGDCDGAVKGANGQPIKVPCDCPPDRVTFIKVRTNTSTLRILRVSLVRLLTPTTNIFRI